LGIISLDFDIRGQLLIRNPWFVRCWEKVGI